MGKTFEASDMPPLTKEMHQELRLLEWELRSAFSKCCNSYSLDDSQAAFEYARTYAVKFYDCYYGFYSKDRNPIYQPHWRPASEALALQRVVKCIEDMDVIHTYFKRNSDLVARIQKTISAHAEPIPLVTGKQASAYIASGIDIASGSPLLKMAVAAAQTSGLQMAPTSAQPKRRIPRSIQSKSAVKKLEDYLNNKGLSQTEFAVRINVDQKTLYRFRATGKVGKPVAQAIAQAMGITLEELVSS